jgi:predicted Fe-S protein YdhL (DUF1289 family)
MEEEVNSPCVSICKYNNLNYCIGCFRYESEIRNWPGFSEKVKAAILEDIKDRIFPNDK